MTMEAAATTGVAYTIRLTMPNDARWVGLLRLTIAGVGDELDLPAERIDDLKLAVTEGSRHAMAAVAGDAELNVSFRVSLGELTIEMTREGTHAGAADDSDISLFVLRAIADDVSLASSGPYRLTIRKTIGT